MLKNLKLLSSFYSVNEHFYCDSWHFTLYQRSRARMIIDKIDEPEIFDIQTYHGERHFLSGTHVQAIFVQYKLHATL